MISIRPICAFSDNYIWLIDDGERAWVVDPGDAAPVEQALSVHRLHLEGVLITHHHPDHIGGVDTLRQQWPALRVVGPRSDNIPQINNVVEDCNEINILGATLKVLSIPGHTLDHIAYFGDIDGKPALFCGDTLFAGGCGRLFEGSPEQMLASLQSLAALPSSTAIYCAHEYTLANLAFAALVEPDNVELHARISNDSAKRERGEPTVPSTLSVELATNPFLRYDQPAVRRQSKAHGAADERAVSVFAAIRRWKDNA